MAGIYVGDHADGRKISAHRTYADLIVDYLYLLGVRRVFGVPGGAIEPFFDALARHARAYPDGIKLIVARHETGAAFMAAGYAKETGNLGVCCSTTGPGATNLVTGIASAFAERDPILVITPQTALRDFGRLAMQDSSDAGVDIVGMLAHCTRFNSLVSHPAQLEGKLLKAISTALCKPQGPVHLSVPIDIMSDPSAPHMPSYDIKSLMQPSAFIDDVSYSKLLSVVNKSRKMVVLVGGGCCRNAAMEKLTTFSEITNSAMVSTPSGKKWINAEHHLYRGVFGFAGHNSAREILLDPEVDSLLAVGSTLDEFDTSAWDKLALLNDKLVHIDSTFDNFSQSPMAKLHVFGDPDAVFQRLITDVLESKQSSTYIDKLPPLTFRTDCEFGFRVNQYKDDMSGIVSADKKFISKQIQQPLIKPQWLMQQLPSVLPMDTRYVIDAGNAWAWSIHYLNHRSAGNFHIGLGFGAMTWAIGNAIGIASAVPDKPVVLITGDGSMLMGGQEITVAVAEKLPVLFIVLNDQALGMVKHGQRLGGGEPIGYQLPYVDFAAAARTTGADGYSVHSREEFEQLDFEKMLSKAGPSLLDVYIDPEEVPPMGIRMSALDRRNGGGHCTVGRRTADKIEP